MTTIEMKKADFDYSAEHAKKVRDQNQKALADNECYLFQTTRVESTHRTNADIVRSNPVVDMRELEMACLKDACAWYSVHRHYLHEKLIATEKELKALKRQLKTGEKPETVTGVGRLITTMCGGDEDLAKTILKTQTETGVTQFHTCDECHRYCYTGGDLYPDGYTCADCDDEEGEYECECCGMETHFEDDAKCEVRDLCWKCCVTKENDDGCDCYVCEANRERLCGV